MSDIIKIYPVGNGDQSLITLKDGTTMAVDCNIRLESVDSTDQLYYDVKKDVLACIKKREGNPFVDVFVLTHGDCDHCRGFRRHFYQGDPVKYKKENREAGEIIIDEMWFSPMIAEEHDNEEESVVQEEAERRLALHLKNDPAKDLPGNRIRIIGYDGKKKYDSLNDLRYTPGTVVDTFNQKKQATFSVFIHAPFKETLASAEPDKNTNSIVFQARFKDKATDEGFAVLALFGGDADYIAWEVILTKTMKSGKDVSHSALDWDLLIAPHHVSWSFFNEHNKKEEPQESSLEVLRYRRPGGIIVASSKKIEDNKDNPPSYLAKQTYIEHLDSSKQFINTAVHPKESALEPVILEITASGPALTTNAKVSAAITSAGGAGAAGLVIKQGGY